MKQTHLATIVSLIIVCFLGAFWWADQHQRLPWQVSTSKPILTVDPNQITQIAINFGETAKEPPVTLVKQDNAWYLASSSGQVRADDNKINKIINKLQSLNRSEPASVNPANHANLQVDAGLIVKLTTSEGDTVLHLGKIGPDYNSEYFRLDSEDIVYRHPAILRTLFTHQSWAASPSANTAKTGK